MLMFDCTLELPTPIYMEKAIQSQLPLFKRVEWVAVTGSTNTDLITRSRERANKKPSLMGAYVQRSGRGRVGRTWENSIGATLMFSCAFDLNVGARYLSILSPLIGISTCKTLRQFVGKHAPELVMKWPNDIQRLNAKLAGILIESLPLSNRTDSCTTIIGLGLNLKNSRILSKNLGRPIADWYSMTRQTYWNLFNITSLVCAMANSWYNTLKKFESGRMTYFNRTLSEADILDESSVNANNRGNTIGSVAVRGLGEQSHALAQTHQVVSPALLSKGFIQPYPTYDNSY